jgi:hypothetical protein
MAGSDTRVALPLLLSLNAADPGIAFADHPFD